MKVISVVRDYGVYKSLVKDNVYNKEAEFIDCNNIIKNEFISIRYNDFLNNYDYTQPAWFIFCHEDWEVKENLKNKLKRLDKNFLYGPIGVGFFHLGFFGIKSYFGQITHSEKNGTRPEKIGIYCFRNKKISTFDCQCLIVHSSLVEKFKLRFDEKLSWDLYVEDFCINAKEKFRITSRILQIKCQHYSKGNVKKRYFEQLSYLQEKYKNAKETYVVVVTNRIVGKPYKWCIVQNSFFSFFYSNKITKKGNRLVKICKIPIWYGKVK